MTNSVIQEEISKTSKYLEAKFEGIFEGKYRFVKVMEIKVYNATATTTWNFTLADVCSFNRSIENDWNATSEVEGNEDVEHRYRMKGKQIIIEVAK